MNLLSLKQSINNYIDYLSIFDYIAYSWLILLIFILLVLSLVLAKKRPFVSTVMIFFSFILLFFAPFGLKYFLDASVRKSIIVDKNITTFHFKDALVVRGSVKNSGKVDFQKCIVRAKIIRYQNDFLKDILNKFKPIRIESIILKEKITKNSKKSFKIVFDKFKYSGEYNVTVDSECY